jgi:hypothetical protein
MGLLYPYISPAMSKHEKIKELRTNQAVRDNMMGLNGKFGVVARYLGKPIMQEGSTMFETTYMDDPYELPDEEMPTMEEDEMIYPVGYVFDGLSRGIHLEIYYNDNEKLLRATYGGYKIYQESFGELECYVPFKEWEDKLEQLYRVAKEIEKEKREDNEVLIQQRIEKQHKAILDDIRKTWGLT